MSSNSENDFLADSAADRDTDTHTARRRWARTVGRSAGKFFCRYLKLEAKVVRLAVRHGVPVSLCRLVFLTIKLIILAALLYVSFWAAVYATVLWAFWKVAELGLLPDGLPEERNGWRSGPSGYGYYCGAYRVDADAYDD